MSVESLTEPIIGWGASNLSSLNGCSASSWWSVAISGTDPHQIKYANLVSNENCGSLTPQWVVGQTLVGKCRVTGNKCQ